MQTGKEGVGGKLPKAYRHSQVVRIHPQEDNIPSNLLFII